MRDHYGDFVRRGAEILAVVPGDADAFRKHWDKENIPYVCLPDPTHKVALLYRQEVNIFKLGRMPLNCIVDTKRRIRYIHYGSSMSDIPDNETFLRVIDELNKSS